MKKSSVGAGIALILSVTIFGTIGLLRRYIPLGSATVAFVRGVVGALTVAVAFLVLRRKPRVDLIKKHIVLLLLSGAAIGINWIFLFEAYNRTTVALATLCYYMAPVFVILASALLFRERLGARRIVCVICAVVGMLFVSGIFNVSADGGEFSGILCALAAAAFYAFAILCNKKTVEVPSLDKTLVQMSAAAIVVLPYALITEPLPPDAFSAKTVVLLLAAGVLHTGIAYILYFLSIARFPIQTVSLCGYVDPAVAILCSAVFLHEPFGVYEAVGVVLILGATLFSELRIGKKSLP